MGDIIIYMQGDTSEPTVVSPAPAPDPSPAPVEPVVDTEQIDKQIDNLIQRISFIEEYQTAVDKENAELQIKISELHEQLASADERIISLETDMASMIEFVSKFAVEKQEEEVVEEAPEPAVVVATPTGLSDPMMLALQECDLAVDGVARAVPGALEERFAFADKVLDAKHMWRSLKDSGKVRDTWTAVEAFLDMPNSISNDTSIGIAYLRRKYNDKDVVKKNLYAAYAEARQMRGNAASYRKAVGADDVSNLYEEGWLPRPSTGPHSIKRV